MSLMVILILYSFTNFEVRPAVYLEVMSHFISQNKLHALSYDFDLMTW